MDNERNTVLILGAGATRAAACERVRDYPPPPSKAEEHPPLNSDFFEIAKAHIENAADGQSRLAYKDVVKTIEELVGNYSASLFKSLEATTTFLFLKAKEDPDPQKYRKAFFDMLILIGGVLARTTNYIDLESSILHRFLLSEMQKKQKVSIITFNYDTVVERIIYAIARMHKEISFVFPGCYRLSEDTELYPFMPKSSLLGGTDEVFPHKDKSHRGIPILKLHGSMNWVAMHGDRHPDFDLMYGKNARVDVSDTYRIFPNAYYYSKEEGEVFHAKPMIIPPIAGKSHVIPDAMGRIWQDAGKALRNADKIITVGYSCSDLDIEAHLLLSENLKDHNPEFNIINPDLAITEKYSAICDINHAKVYKSIRDWIDDPSNQ